MKLYKLIVINEFRIPNIDGLIISGSFQTGYYVASDLEPLEVKHKIEASLSLLNPLLIELTDKAI